MEAIEGNEIDYIFEEKYFPSGYNKYTLREAILRLERSTKYYMDKTKRTAKPLLLIVVQRGDFAKEEQNELAAYANKKLKFFKEISTLTIYFDELQQLTKDTLLKLMHRD